MNDPHIIRELMMNLKKTFVSLIATGTLLLTGVIGVGATDTTTGTVTVTSGGTFNPQFCQTVSLSTVSVQSNTAATSVGSIYICVEDTAGYRGERVISVSSGDFTAEGSRPIPASNFKIVKTYNPGQSQWSSSVCGAVLDDGSNRPCVGDPAGLANSGATRVTAGPVEWTTPGSLAGNGQPVLHFWNGMGTTGPAPIVLFNGSWGTVAQFDVALTVPAGQRAATYTADLTLDVASTTAP